MGHDRSVTRPHFPGLDPAVRERLGRLGIDPDQSADARLAEVRVKPPPRLLHTMATLELTHGGYGYRCGCPCLVCLDGHRIEQGRKYPRKRAA